MTSTVASRDVQEIVTKLTSDKAKAREEGIKLLTTCMEGQRSVEFCRYLSENSSMLKLNEVPQAETWSFLVKILINCVSLEISSSKKRPPKTNFSKALKTVVVKAQDDNYSGKSLFLLPVVKLLFNHACDVLKDVSIFFNDYSRMLRHLLATKHYRFHMRRRIYSNLILLVMEKLESSLLPGNIAQVNYSVEEIFRMLHSLLENPPGDISDDLRDDVTRAFVKICSCIGDDGTSKVRKLIECINMFLMKDGPNLGCRSLEIHDAVKQFVYRSWFAPKELSKDHLVLYVKLQLSLTRGVVDGAALLEQLLDVLSRELDQMSSSSTNTPRGDALTSFQCSVVKLAALVFFRACTNRSRASTPEKRARRENVVVQIKERLVEGKWSWHAVFFFLICNHSTRLMKDLFIYWFENISANFERMINKVNLDHSNDCLLWILRSLLRLSSSLLFAVPIADSSWKSSTPMNEVRKGMHVIWSCLMQSLPTLVNRPSIVDAALMVLSNLLLSDTRDSYFVPLEIWDLQVFKRLPSVSVLLFISCYFSRRASQCNHQDALYIRQTILRAVLVLLGLKERPYLDEQLIVAVPAAAYALCVGSTPLLSKALELSPLLSLPEDMELKTEARLHENPQEFFDCSVEFLAKIEKDCGQKVNLSKYNRHIRLPRKLRDQLLHEMENHFTECMKNDESTKVLLSEVMNTCALLSNFMYASYSTRMRDEYVPFFLKMGGMLLELLDQALSIIERTCNNILSGCLVLNSIIGDMKLTLASFESFIRSPLLSKWQDKNGATATLYAAIIHSVERLPKALAELYVRCSGCTEDLHAKKDFPILLDSCSGHVPVPSYSIKSFTEEIDFGMNNRLSEADAFSEDGDQASQPSISLVNQKLGIISIMSCFFANLPSITWELLYNLKETESDPRVLKNILSSLCQHPHWSSSCQLLDLVMSMTNDVNACKDLKLQCSHVLSVTCSLVESLLLMNGSVKHWNASSSSRKTSSEECLIPLGDLVNNVAENSSLDWRDRTKIIYCICYFVSRSPQIAQSMIEKLFVLLHDPDYRVRFCLARRIGILFQTWDGHLELFQDLCSNFAMKLVSFSGGKVVRAEDVLAAGPTPGTIVETTVTTLLHVIFHSEKVELEAVFMICVVAAIDPSHRELVSAALDSISEELCYTNRAKYMEELIGPILFHWVACGVSLVALFETRDLFVMSVEPVNFAQYCCQWLLPALILQEDESNLKWIAKVACMPCADLVKQHFVHIFSICMALHCSKKDGWDQGSRAVGTSILHVGQISEHERDELIKKRMVSIVNHIISLASTVSDPPVPLFSKETVALAIQTVVDGFLDSEDQSRSINLVDKINILRPDRVFMFVVDMHYKVTAAAHHRHKRNHLAGIEVLVDVLGSRAAFPSTLNYLLNLIGQFIGCQSLTDQCCCIISKLLEVSRENPSVENSRVLGEQLQFLVSKLVECCISSVSHGKLSSTASSQVVLLLEQLTIGSDTSLYEYIKELEPFPEFDIFEDFRRFHLKISQTYSPRVHLINFVKRAHHVPSRLLLCSLEALYKHVFTKGMCLEEDGDILKNANWDSDNEIVHAAWSLVQTCSSHDTNNLSPMVSDFISRVGIGDPHRVVFHPSPESVTHVSRMIKAVSAADPNIHMDTDMSNEVILVLMRLLKKYLMDESVEIIDIASRALRGILSTDKGQQALLQLDSYERSLIEVHSKGVNLELVQRLIANLHQTFCAGSIRVEDSTVWNTFDKTFDAWICPIVYAMISYCDDLILRLCQDIVLVKPEVSELLFSNVIVNISRRKDSDVDLRKIISSKVQETILIESNTLTKSIQIFLYALNELRLCHVMERTKSSAALQKLLSSKSRTASMKLKDYQMSHAGSSESTLFWDKVYWLTVDYLVVAKSATHCGSYFTAVLYVEHWCEEHFNSLSLGSPDFSQNETLPHHIEILVSAVTQINEPDSLYGIIQSHKLTSQIITFEHEGNWSKALEYYDLQVRSEPIVQVDGSSYSSLESSQQAANASFPKLEHAMIHRGPHKGLVRSLQQIGCTHVLDVYCQGLTSQRGRFQHDLEFTELQYEAAWRAGNWDFCPLYSGDDAEASYQYVGGLHFNENLHSCLRALQEGGFDEFHRTLQDSKKDLLLSICHASKESTEFIYSSIVKLQIFYHLGMAWDLRWSSSSEKNAYPSQRQKSLSEPIVPPKNQLQCLHRHWNCILKQAELHMNLLEPFIAFRRVLLLVLDSVDSTLQHLLESASILRKGSRFSQSAAALHEFKFRCSGMGEDYSNLYWLGRLEEAKLLWVQGQHEMAINLADHISQKDMLKAEAPDVYCLVGKWLAETRSSNSRTILEKYLKKAVNVAEDHKATDKLSMEKRNQRHFHLAHYADALFRTHEERLNSNEWQVGMRLRKHKTKELEALIKRYKSMAKGDKTDYSLKIQELQKQLTMDREEADKLEEDRDNFLCTALEGYKRCLIIGEKYDVQVVFRLVSIWFSLSNRQIVVDSMLSIIKEVQSYKFILLVYQIASRMGGTIDSTGPPGFQFALVSLVKKMALDHPYHTLIQLLALANGDRIKDKQRSRNSFVVDVDKKVAAEDLLRELTSHHGAIIRQMKQMVEIYIKLAELETKREDTNKKIALPRELRSIRQLELVPVITSNVPVDRTCQYPEGSFPYYKGMTDSITVMNGINAPKVVECLGSNGNRYRQLAKSGNDDLRQDAVMEQFFGLVNTFLENNNDTWKRRLRIRTYKVVPFTPSAGVLEWVNGTFPLGEYLIGCSRSGGAHGRYGVGDWNFLKCRQHMTAEPDKRKAFKEVCQNFRPVMHYFFLERFSNPADWFEKRLAYTRSVAASSMVGYIVGLGDRHSMNVLIDQATAEVIHIDLGVAFEQGLMLKTPERVPFRLTRDIIDGMGVTGVEGVFRRCCEETLSVMRTNKEALLTIIEVFIHDPLYKWALSPLKAMQRQKDIDDDMDAGLDSDEDEYEGNKDAARALLRVKQKLDGYEDGEMRSVHGQVQQLIQDAIDPDRLCNMFPGWGAWL